MDNEFIMSPGCIKGFSPAITESGGGMSGPFGISVRSRDWVTGDSFFFVDKRTADEADTIARLVGGEAALKYLNNLMEKK